MKYLLFMITLLSASSSQVIFEFNKKSEIKNWVIVDDVVMGGRSSGSFKLNSDGLGVFEGTVSTENYGGFSSLRYRFKRTSTKDYSKIIMKLKGDGKKFQFRIKANSSDYYSYSIPFVTTGKWQEIEIYLKDLVPTFRGRTVDKPNFDNDSFEELTFLFGNKKNEKFKLLLDKIELK